MWIRFFEQLIFFITLFARATYHLNKKTGTSNTVECVLSFYIACVICKIYFIVMQFWNLRTLISFVTSNLNVLRLRIKNIVFLCTIWSISYSYYVIYNNKVNKIILSKVQVKWRRLEAYIPNASIKSAYNISSGYVFISFGYYYL